jgi:hypothetical protein
MLIPFIKISKSGRDYTLKQILINPMQIIYVHEDELFKRKLKEGVISLDIHQSTGFSKIRLDNSGITEEITVVGTPDLIHRKIESGVLSSRRQLLQG